MRLGPDNFCFIQHTRDGDHIRDHINDTENPLLFGTFLSVAKKMPGGLCTLSKVMNQRGAASILSSKIELGGDASAAAGPKGRDASADSDLWMRAEILSYSRSRGLFAGISLEGSTLRPDNKAAKSQQKQSCCTTESRSQYRAAISPAYCKPTPPATNQSK
jgi:hypothetical protein